MSEQALTGRQRLELSLLCEDYTASRHERAVALLPLVLYVAAEGIVPEQVTPGDPLWDDPAFVLALLFSHQASFRSGGYAHQVLWSRESRSPQEIDP